jgi:hypothetical protein
VHKRAHGRVALARSRWASPSTLVPVTFSAEEAVRGPTCVAMCAFHSLPLPCMPCNGPRASPCARFIGIQGLGKPRSHVALTAHLGEGHTFLFKDAVVQLGAVKKARLQRRKTRNGRMICIPLRARYEQPRPSERKALTLYRAETNVRQEYKIRCACMEEQTLGASALYE